VSVYPLTVEDGTPLAAAVAEGRMPAPDPDVAADMMLAAEVALAAAGLRRYEVANYAQPGHEARHNSAYWTGGAYLGVGPQAASMLPAALYGRVADGEGWTAPPAGADVARTRFTREATVQDYLRRPLAMPGPIEFLSGPEARREDVMLGLRMREGVAVAQAEAAGVATVLDRLSAQGLVKRSVHSDGVERWSTTERGWLLGNQVFGPVWAGQ
jgi:oxygen-independent coproporphyrinogen-3 oxidase